MSISLTSEGVQLVFLVRLQFLQIFPYLVFGMLVNVLFRQLNLDGELSSHFEEILAVGVDLKHLLVAAFDLGISFLDEGNPAVAAFRGSREHGLILRIAGDLVIN